VIALQLFLEIGIVCFKPGIQPFDHVDVRAWSSFGPRAVQRRAEDLRQELHALDEEL